jgi:hypothetical protein
MSRFVPFVVELSQDLLHNLRTGRYPGDSEQAAVVRALASFATGGAAVRRAGERNEEEFMATQSGGIQPLYGVIIRDKCKTADLSMLQAYRTVAHDLLKDASGPAADELKASLTELDKAIAAKQPK